MNHGTTRVERFVGLDVHAATIVVAVAEAKGGEVRSLGTIPNTPDGVRKLIGKLGLPERWRACYEAGPTGYALYRQMVGCGYQCEVVAPTLIPVRPGDRVKTDRRDAERLARGLRAGDLTAVWVPDDEHEALRDLVRARESAKSDQLRARHRLSKYLLRHGHRPKVRMTPWTQKYMDWIRTEVKFDRYEQQATVEEYLEEVEHQTQRIVRLEKTIDKAVDESCESFRLEVACLQALRGVGKLTAITVLSEVGRLSRFATAGQAMAYAGLVPSEHSSGERTRRGGITKTGNAHVRRVLGEAAFAARFAPTLTRRLRLRQKGLPASVVAIADKARHRLHERYRWLLGRGKPKQQVLTAVARELMGFIWDIGKTVEVNGITNP